jgi:uncharacterized protein (TIRG00374 family)
VKHSHHSPAKVWLKLLISLAVGGGCFWLAARKVDHAALDEALDRFDPSYIVPLVVISLLIQVFRALRWKVELQPLARLPLVLLWEVVAVAYMMINVLPFRLGEPVRPVLLSWKTGLKIPAIVGNWVFEKMLDTAAMVLFIHLALLLNDLPHWARHASMFSLVMFLCMLTLVVGFWLRGDWFFQATAGRALPEKACAWTRNVLESARSGLQILPDRKLVAVAFLLTIALWFLPIISSWVLMRAFDFDLPFAAAFAVFVAIGAGTALPNPPGMIGVFQIASVVALGMFGVPKADALAYGIVLNAIQFVTLVLQGLVAVGLLGIGVGEVTRAAVSHHVREFHHARPN